MIYVLYGDEEFLLEKKLNELKEKYNISMENMNLNVYDALETPIQEIIDDCNMPSFFSEYKMVLVKNPYFCTTQKVKAELSGQSLKPLEDYLTHPYEQCILIIYHTIKNFDERKSIVKKLKKYATFVLFEKLVPLSFKATIRASITARNCEIEEKELEYLLALLPDDLMNASNEVEKLCLYTNKITKEDIDLIITKPREQNAFELVNAILSKNQAKAISIYKDLMVFNEEPIKLIVMIAGQFRLLYQVKLLSNKGYNDQEIGKILSINPYRIKYLRKDMARYGLKDLSYYLDELSQLDLSIKKGELDKYMALELFLMKVR